MVVSRITREDLVEQAVTDHLRNGIFVERAYPATRVAFVDAFLESNFEGPLDKNYLALGFNFDDGGEALELGSDLIQRTYAFEVFVIGMEPLSGRNLANAVRDVFEAAENLPLRDVADPARPIIDYLQVDPVRVQRQPVPSPKPWQESLWVVTVPVVDEYYSRAMA